MNTLFESSNRLKKDYDEMIYFGENRVNSPKKHNRQNPPVCIFKTTKRKILWAKGLLL